MSRSKAIVHKFPPEMPNVSRYAKSLLALSSKWLNTPVYTLSDTFLSLRAQDNLLCNMICNFSKHMTGGEAEMGVKHVNACTYMHVCTRLCTHRCTTLSADPKSCRSSRLRDTNQQQAALWMNCDKVLFFCPPHPKPPSPPPSVFCLPGTLIGSMQSNVTNWIILAPELEAAHRRSREHRAQSSAPTPRNPLWGWRFITFCSWTPLGFYTSSTQGTSGTFFICLGPFYPLGQTSDQLLGEKVRGPLLGTPTLGEYKLQHVMLGRAEALIPGQWVSDQLWSDQRGAEVRIRNLLTP